MLLTKTTFNATVNIRLSCEVIIPPCFFLNSVLLWVAFSVALQLEPCMAFSSLGVADEAGRWIENLRLLSLPSDLSSDIQLLISVFLVFHKSSCNSVIAVPSRYLWFFRPSCRRPSRGSSGRPTGLCRVEHDGHSFNGRDSAIENDDDKYSEVYSSCLITPEHLCWYLYRFIWN